MIAKIKVITPLENTELSWDHVQCPVCSQIIDRSEKGIALFIMEETFICHCGEQLVVPPIPAMAYH